MKNWKDLFYWMEIISSLSLHVKLQAVGKKKPSYSITADGISYFPVTRKMAKKLLKDGMEVEVLDG